MGLSIRKQCRVSDPNGGGHTLQSHPTCPSSSTLARSAPNTRFRANAGAGMTAGRWRDAASSLVKSAFEMISGATCRAGQGGA
jgi:hypothetical protein